MGAKKRGLNRFNLIVIASVILILIGAGILIFTLSDSETGEPTTVQTDPISQQCSLACETNQKSAFCDVQRTLSDGTQNTCENLANQNLYNVESCPSISCEEIIDQTCVSGLGGNWETPEADGSCPTKTEFDFERKRSPSDSPPTPGEICCYYYN